MRDPSSGWLQVSSAEFFLLWTALGLGEPPLALHVTHLGRTAAARAVLAEAASRALTARDLGTVTDPARDLALVLRRLAAGAVALDLRVTGQGSPLVGHATAGPRGAAVAARVDGEVRLGATHSATVLLDSLAPAPAGPGRPANVAVTDYEHACAEGARDGVTAFARVLHEAGIRQAEVDLLAHVVTARRGGGQLGVTADRNRAVLSWVDTADGRYALRRHGAWLTVTPADQPRLAAMAEEMLSAIRTG